VKERLLILAAVTISPSCRRDSLSLAVEDVRKRRDLCRREADSGPPLSEWARASYAKAADDCDMWLAAAKELSAKGEVTE